MKGKNRVFCELKGDSPVNLRVSKGTGGHGPPFASKFSNTAATYLDSPFDWDFDITKDSTIYCTGLLYAALKAAASGHILPTVYAKQVDKNVIPLEAISNNPAIDEIVYFSQENTQGKAK